MNPFESVGGRQSASNDEGRTPGPSRPHTSQGYEQSSDHSRDPGAKSGKPDADTPDNVVPIRRAAPVPSPTAQYLDQNADLESLCIPYARFPGTKMVLPDREAVCSGWSAFVEEIAPDPAPVIERKEKVPYYIAGTLREAELINAKLREQRLINGQSTIGKQRSSAHIETLGPVLLLDDDTDVFAREPALLALGTAALIYSSHSYGFTKGDATEPARGGRVVLVLNRMATPAEYPVIWDAVNHLFGGGFDEHGRSPSLCYGRHARRSDQAPHRRIVIEGAAFDVDALIELGRSLRPEHVQVAPDQRTTGWRKRVSIDEIERARLMGAVRPPNEYGEWASGAAAFKRAVPDDIEAAFQCFDVWSSCSAKYEGTEATRRKFEEVPADYDGGALPVTLGMLHWRARHRAEAVIAALYSPARHWQKAKSLEGVVMESAGAGITPPKGAEPIPPDTLKPEDGIVALDYLLYCWSEKVFQQIVAGQAIPQNALEEARRRSLQRRETIDLAGRTLHRWAGKNLAADTAALAEAIIRSNPMLYRFDNTLIRVVAPKSDQATAARIRKVHGYDGPPGEAGDPALHAGERLATILPSDHEALREIIASGVATKRRVNRGTSTKPDWKEEVGSFAFKPSAKLHDEPDAGVLKDLGKRGLVAQVPEVLGVITAPVMPDLPCSTNPDDLLQPGADRIVTTPGFDAASGLFLSPLGTVIDVPASPSASQVKEAAKLLLAPWADFPFVSPGEGLSAEVSLSAVIYATMIAVDRRALSIAPGIGISSHGEGMSSGKTLAGEVIGTIATGEVPTPVSLSIDFTEQRKEIITYFVEGDGTLFLDNIPTGTRFDAAPLASAMTSSRFKGRLLGANKQIEANTRTMIIATGCSLNMAGDLASRFLSSRLDTRLERPEDRSADAFRIRDLRTWVVEHRQQLIAAVHTIVRAYLHECRRCGGTPVDVSERRQVIGTRFGGRCEVLRDAFLRAFPDLPDPFLSFLASATNSSTKAEAALVLAVLDRILANEAGRKCAPAWATTPFVGVKLPERAKWSQKFRARWSVVTTAKLQRRYQTPSLTDAEDKAWKYIQGLMRLRCGRRDLRAGRGRFTSSEITNMLQAASNEQAIVEGAMQGKPLNPVSLGRWLKERLVDAPINGLVLRSAQGRGNCAQFWITTGGVT